MGKLTLEGSLVVGRNNKKSMSMESRTVSLCELVTIGPQVTSRFFSFPLDRPSSPGFYRSKTLHFQLLWTLTKSTILGPVSRLRQYSSLRVPDLLFNDMKRSPFPPQYPPVSCLIPSVEVLPEMTRSGGP